MTISTMATPTPKGQSHAPKPADNMRKDQRNVFATMAVFAGISSWVPLVIVVAFPLTLMCALLALATSKRAHQKNGLKAAGVGVALATAALLAHILFAMTGLMVSYIIPVFQSLVGM